MKRLVSWTKRLEDGVKREVRVTVSQGDMKWQFKRSDEERWDYKGEPTAADWDALEDIIGRRIGRGRAVGMLPAVKRMREKAGC